MFARLENGMTKQTISAAMLLCSAGMVYLNNRPFNAQLHRRLLAAECPTESDAWLTRMDEQIREKRGKLYLLLDKVVKNYDADDREETQNMIATVEQEIKELESARNELVGATEELSTSLDDANITLCDIYGELGDEDEVQTISQEWSDVMEYLNENASRTRLPVPDMVLSEALEDSLGEFNFRRVSKIPREGSCGNFIIQIIARSRRIRSRFEDALERGNVPDSAFIVYGADMGCDPAHPLRYYYAWVRVEHDTWIRVVADNHLDSWMIGKSVMTLKELTTELSRNPEDTIYRVEVEAEDEA